MKLLILLSIFTVSILASSTKPVEIPDDKLAVSTAKRKEIDESIKGSEALQSCKEKDTEADIDACISNNLAGLDEEQLDAIAKDLGSSAYEVTGSVKSEAIKKFMQERINKFVYGDKKKGKKEKAKVVGHDIYRDLYKNQLGKNMLLDVNTYCLENMGFGGPKDVLYNYVAEPSGKTETNKDGKEVSIPKEENGLKILGYIQTGKLKDTKGDLIPAYVNSKIVWLNDFNEYVDGSDNKRSIKDIKELKDFYLQAKKSDSTTTYAQSMNNFCREYVIETACVAYKCYNTDNPTVSLSTNEMKQCMMIPGFQADGSTVDKLKKKGQLACNLKSKLEIYKKTFLAIKDQEEALAKAGGNVKFFQGDSKTKIIETVDTDFDDIDEMTSISSRDLTNSVDEFKNAKENAEQLREDCKEESEECLKVAGGLSKDDKDQIDLQDRIATEAYKARLEQMKGASKEEFQEFLEKYDLLDKYGSQLDKLKSEDLAKLITNDYQSKKKALTESMFEKYKAATKKDEPETAISYDSSIDEAAKEIEGDKDYVETMFEYNNIVSSYLQLTDEEGNSAGSLASMRESEVKDIQKYADGEEDQKTYEQYEQLFQDEENAGGASKDKSVDFIGFLDTVLDD